MTRTIQPPRYDFPTITVTGSYRQVIANKHTQDMVKDTYVKIDRDAVNNVFYLKETSCCDNFAKQICKGNNNIPVQVLPEVGTYGLRVDENDSAIWELVPIAEFLEYIKDIETVKNYEDMITNKLKDLGFSVFTATDSKVKEDYDSVKLIFGNDTRTYTFLNKEWNDVDALKARYSYAVKGDKHLLVDNDKQVAFDVFTVETFKI